MDYDDRHRGKRVGSSTAGLLEHLPQPGIVVADDGRELHTTTFEPVGPVVAVALVASAMATPARYYAAFARRLAEHGVRTVTFDYRTAVGTPDEMRAESADVDRWSADAAAVLAVVADGAERAGVPVTWIGHSLGGQIIPFVQHERLAAIITIAAGDGYWRRNAPGLRWKVPFLWRIAAPIAIRVAGYFPGRAMGLGGDLPAGVLTQWSRWCLHPEYLQADHPEAPELFAAVTAPFRSLSFTDDEVLTDASVRHLNGWYTGTDQLHQRFSPDQLGVERVGHHGFFRPAFAPLWDELVLPWVAGLEI
jgi:predicted alpha/beta hydrolase